MGIRLKRAKLNILVSLLCQAVTLICGLIVPRLMIGAFGSEIYGATASIAQFLAYITLLEGGVGGVARAALYGPLANNNSQAINEIVSEIKRFFRIIAYIYGVYVIVLACSFKSISNIQVLDWLTTCILVVVISISTFAQYFIGVSYSILLQASQKTYVSQWISLIGTVVNTILVVILVNSNCDIIIVKLASSIVFVLRPIALWLYVKKNYHLVHCGKGNTVYLKQKYTGLGQHLAYFLHSNTDIMVLTWFANLTSVAIYSVYNMVISQIQHITSSFSTGMEALFGDMLAKKEYNVLAKTFGYYETLISIVSLVLFSCTSALIVPFVKLYTAGVADADYVAPIFAILLIVSALLYCLRMPYHSMTVAAGHFKETKWAAYGEAIINIAISIVLVNKLGLVGVAIGTIVATLFRFVYYVIYLSKNIFYRKLSLFFKRIAVNSVTFITISIFAGCVINTINIANYGIWLVCGLGVGLLSVVVTFGLNLLFYRSDFKAVISRLKKQRAR